MSEPLPEAYDIFSHPDIIDISLHNDDPETLRMMKEVREFDQAIQDGVLTTDEEMRTVLDELNGRWTTHRNEMMRVSGTIYAEADGFVESDYLDRGLLYFKAFTLMPSGADDTRTHIRYEVITDLQSTSDDAVIYTLDASSHVAFPNLISIDKMSHLASGLMLEVDDILMGDELSFSEIISKLAEVEFVRNIPEDDMRGVYTFIAAYLNHAMSMDELLGVNCDVDGIVFGRGDNASTPHVVESNYTITSPTFFFYVHDANFIELCIMGDASRRGGTRTIDSLELAIPLGAMANVRPVGGQPW